MSLNLFTPNKSMKLVPGLRPENFSRGTASLSWGEWFQLPVFLVFQIAVDVKNAYAKKTVDEIPVEGNCRQFSQGCQYERLEGQEGRRFSATKMNFEKPPAGDGARG